MESITTMTPIKFKDQMKAKFDKRQTELAPNTETGVKEKTPTFNIQTANMTDIVTCPFCLYFGKIQEFLVSTKKGISQSKAACPQCKNGMMMRSLISEMSIEDYAEWCYEYSGSGFWQKVPFRTWAERLRKLGWAYKFWKKYRQLKGEDTTEGYKDYIMRKQYEQAEEEGWTE